MSHLVRSRSFSDPLCGTDTLESVEASVAAVAEADADDYFCIVFSDANFERYGITPEDLKRVMNSNPKVKT